MDDQVEQTHLNKASDASEDVLEQAQPSAVVQFNPGSIIIEKYLVIKLLGRGGMGSVYQVRDLQQRTEFALKCLNSQHTNDVVWRRFDNEARAANRLDHPNLIKVHDSGLLPDGQPYFVMDLVHGVTLTDLLKQKTRLPLEQALKLMIQVAFAIAYAHDNGVIHRDIKPSNIMIGDEHEITEGNVKLVDFGIAKLTGQDNFNQLTLTRTGEIFGSPLYMSPEQCAGIAIDHRSDLYSFGCVMYECLTGAPPIIADNAFSTMIKHQNEVPVSMREASLGITFPNASELIVAKLLEKSPAQRYQNAHELLTDLVSLERHLVSGSSAPSVVHSKPSVTSKSLKQTKKTRDALDRKSVLFGALLLGAGFMAGFGTARLSQPSQQAQTVHTSVEIEKAQTFAQPTGFSLTDDSENNHKFFSTSGGPTRDFVFPEKSIGSVRAGNSNFKTAALWCEFVNFQPLQLVASEYFCQKPHLINRFRSDELYCIELKDCDLDLTTILKGLTRFETLTNLDLNNSTFKDSYLPIIGEMSHLTTLDLTGARLTGASLAKLKILGQLKKLSCAQITDPKPLVAALQKNSKLAALDLSRSNLDDADLFAICQKKTLNHLDLTDDTALNDKSLTYLLTLPSLDYLDIEGCPVTAKSIAVFKKMHALEHLHLSPTGWSKQQRRELENLRPGKLEVRWATVRSEDDRKFGESVMNAETQYAKSMNK